jgi:DNA-binding transcriptional regulator YhcF (GntR family)
MKKSRLDRKVEKIFQELEKESLVKFLDGFSYQVLLEVVQKLRIPYAYHTKQNLISSIVKSGASYTDVWGVIKGRNKK